MKINFKKIVFALIIIFILIQFYQPTRTISIEQDDSLNFTSQYNAPTAVQEMLKTSCYDCHSNTTVYPWYANIQPGRFFMDSHIDEGRKEVNFSEFGTYSNRKQSSKLQGIIKQIKADEMPLFSYTLIHKNAIFSKEKKVKLLNWLNQVQDSISKIN